MHPNAFVFPEPIIRYNPANCKEKASCRITVILNASEESPANKTRPLRREAGSVIMFRNNQFVVSIIIPSGQCHLEQAKRVERSHPAAAELFLRLAPRNQHNRRADDQQSAQDVEDRRTDTAGSGKHITGIVYYSDLIDSFTTVISAVSAAKAPLQRSVCSKRYRHREIRKRTVF